MPRKWERAFGRDVEMVREIQERGKKIGEEREYEGKLLKNRLLKS
jgi:hypothetical protein